MSNNRTSEVLFTIELDENRIPENILWTAKDGGIENEESKAIALKNAIQEGLNSPRVEDFDFDENLKNLKAEKRKNG